MKIEQNTFVVTGGASGLGLAVVQYLFQAKANIAIFDVNDDMAQQCITALNDHNRVIYFKCDVTNENSVKDAIDAVIKKFGGIHGFIQCAGIATPCPLISRKGDLHSLAHFKKLIDLNLIGSFIILKYGAAAMAKLPAQEGGERGVFVHVASVAAFEGQVGQLAYSASKLGLVGMMLPAARELSRFGIRVVTVAPGVMKTPLLAKLPKKAVDQLTSLVPFPQRLGEPAEFASIVAETIRNQYINAETLRLDGGIRFNAAL